MDTWIIILGVVIVIIIFFLIRYYTSGTTSLASHIYLKNTNTDISSNAITNPGSILYTFGSWVYINNFASPGSILYSYVAGASGQAVRPVTFSLLVGGTTVKIPGGTTDLTIGKQNSPVLTAMVGTPGTIPNIITITNNFPIQKWVYVTVAVDTIYVDCYIDGKLVISSPLKTQITQSVQNPSITFVSPLICSPPVVQNPDIHLTKLTRWDYPLDPQSVYNEYSAGNGLSQGGDLSIGLTVDSDNGSKNYTIYSNS